MSKLQRNAMMRRCIPFIALAAAVGSAPVLAAEHEEQAPPAYREDLQRLPPREGKPLRFKAPPSQLLDPWRCGVGNVYARPPSAASCGYDPRLASEFLLDYPFASMRLMPPLQPTPAPSLTGEPAAGGPVPGAPPSQLPRITDPSYPLFFP
ncbi:MAG: hypothetical protein V4858_19035 [Pseudomonadota bacterium]